MGKWTILKEAVLFMYNSSFWYPFPYFGPIYSFTWLPRTGVSCTVTNPGSSKLDQVFLFPWFSLASLPQFLHVLVVIRLLIKHVSLILAGRGELPTLPCNRIDHVPSHRQSDFQSLRKRIPQSRRGKRSKNPEENSRRAEAGIGRARGRWRREGGGGGRLHQVCQQRTGSQDWAWHARVCWANARARQRRASSRRRGRPADQDVGRGPTWEGEDGWADSLRLKRRSEWPVCGVSSSQSCPADKPSGLYAGACISTFVVRSHWLGGAC